MTHLVRIGMAAVLLMATGCFCYRGPHGVESSLERSLGVPLHRDVGIKLGPMSTRFVASLSHDDDVDSVFQDLTSVGVVVFERGSGRGRAPHRIEPKELGLNGYTTMLSSSDGDEQVLILTKTRGGSIHEMVVLAVDTDEVTLTRLTGQLDELLAKAIDEVHATGAHGARGLIPLAQ